MVFIPFICSDRRQCAVLQHAYACPVPDSEMHCDRVTRCGTWYPLCFYALLLIYSRLVLHFSHSPSWNEANCEPRCDTSKASSLFILPSMFQKFRCTARDLCYCDCSYAWNGCIRCAVATNGKKDEQYKVHHQQQKQQEFKCKCACSVLTNVENTFSL